MSISSPGDLFPVYRFHLSFFIYVFRFAFMGRGIRCIQHSVSRNPWNHYQTLSTACHCCAVLYLCLPLCSSVASFRSPFHHCWMQPRQVHITLLSVGYWFHTRMNLRQLMDARFTPLIQQPIAYGSSWSHRRGVSTWMWLPCLFYDYCFRFSFIDFRFCFLFALNTIHMGGCRQ